MKVILHKSKLSTNSLEYKYKYKHDYVPRKRKTNLLLFTKLQDSLMLSFILVSIFTVGIQPGLQANHAFAQADFDPTEANVIEVDKSNSDISSFDSRSNLLDRFMSVSSSTAANEDQNILALDEREREGGDSTELSSASSSQSVQAQSSNEVYGDFNGDGRDDLAVGVPFEGVDTGAGTIGGAGAVNVLYGSSNGLSATSPRPDQIWSQNSPDVNDLAELNDNFGSALA